MSNRSPTGSRIREYRQIAGFKQTELARQIGISAAYLNLIEHNKRRIGGKLVTDIAAALGLEPGVFSEGAEVESVAALRQAAATAQARAALSVTSAPEPELDRVEDFAARFPGWANLVGAQSRRIADLEHSVEALTDRLSHDPALSASLHDVLTTASAIGSAAAILTETREIEDEWRDRFHRNIHEDSQRLAASSQSLVQFLEAPAVGQGGEVGARAASPEEELDTWLEAVNHHIDGLEHTDPVSDETLFEQPPGLASDAVRAQAKPIFARYRRDAVRMPLAEMQVAASELKYNPVALAQRFDVPLSAVFRRLAALPRVQGKGRIGLAICDSSGALTYRKPLGGFAMPRTGGGCPHWPLYQSLSRPMQPVRAVVETGGREATRYLAFAIAEPLGDHPFDASQVFEATMLILPRDLVAFPDSPVQQVGSNCRVLPCPACQERRAG